MIGQTVGHYRILDQLGKGGMGEVYLAEDMRLGRKAALKFLRSDSAETPESRERFLREARAASRLDHPNICTVYEIDDDPEVRAYIAMAHYEGETLKQVLDRGPLAPARAVEVAVQVGDGLAEAHRHGVVHRDVKPANLMLVLGGGVKVLDFGLAKLQDHEDLTRPGVAMGTVAYMSPEQVTGGPIDARTDVWALGVVLYEMLTGDRPFQGQQAQAVSWAIVHRDPPPLIGISDALSGLVLRALSKSPVRRHPSMADLVTELRRVEWEGSAVSTVLRPALVTGVPSPAPTVGRAPELDALKTAFAEAARGRARMVVVSGEAGLGKTTLVEKFLSDLTAGGEHFVLLRGGCSERLAGTGAYLPLLEALRDALRGDAASAMAADLRTLSPTWYVQVAPDDPSAARLEEGARVASPERRKLELGAFLGDLSRQQPVVVFLDDLHWADVSTVDLLAHLASRLDAARLLFVLTLRPAELLLNQHPFRAIESDLRARGVSREIPLAFLGDSDIEAYLQITLPDHRLPESFAGFLRAKTEGSPLFMVGIVDDMKARGIIAKKGDHWVLAQPLPTIEKQLPQTVRGMIERKLGQLSESERLLLEAGGVQGFELDTAVIAHVLELAEETVEDQLDALRRVHAFLDFVGEEELPSRRVTVRYRFVHALYHDVLQDSLRPTRRRTLAGQVANALRELHAARLPPVASEVAVLLETARDFGPAADHYLLAAERSVELHAGREAALLAGKGLECAHHLPEGLEREQREDRLQAVRDESLGDAREMAGERGEARALYGSARQHALKEDRLRRARLDRKTGRTWQLDRDYEKALEAHARAETTLAEGAGSGTEEWREWIQIQLERMELYYFASRLDELEELCVKARSVVEAHGAPAQRSRFFVSLCLAGLRRDRYRPSELTLGHAHAGLGASRESGDLREEAWARFCVGFCHLWRGEHSMAEQHLLGALETSERIRDETTRTRSLTYLAVLHRIRRDLDRCREYTARTLAAATATGMKEYVGTARANEAWIGCVEGDPARARERAREALDLWSQLSTGHASAAFVWTAHLPLIAATLEGQELEEAVVSARALLGSITMELPAPLLDAAAAAVRAWERRDVASTRDLLHRVTEVGRQHGLL